MPNTSTLSPAPDARQVELGGRTFAVPVLPLRANRVIYPLCRDLSANASAEDSFIGRLAASNGAPDAVTDAEFDKLIEIAYEAACAADPLMTLDQFEEMPITPPELLNAFFLIRLQTGGWVAPSNDITSQADSAEDAAPGEAAGA
jgi:hypothetical protein